MVARAQGHTYTYVPSKPVDMRRRVRITTSLGASVAPNIKTGGRAARRYNFLLQKKISIRVYFVISYLKYLSFLVIMFVCYILRNLETIRALNFIYLIF